MRNTVLLSTMLCATLLLAVHSSQAAHVPGYIKAAIDDPARPGEDRERDAQRKPAETLEFAGIKPGQRVIELFPGRGYFTRLFSKIVGPKGHVYALSPPRVPTLRRTRRILLRQPRQLPPTRIIRM